MSYDGIGELNSHPTSNDWIGQV